nr:5-formyltetrahydrofolate cyclo-ligase [Helicobacter sp. MIT 05-5293]
MNFSDKIVNQALYKYLRERHCRSVLVYLPLHTEVDITPLIATLRKQKVRVFVPFIQELSFKMIPLRMPLKKNLYGIYESNNSLFHLIKVDSVIIPVLGIDRDFRRIGFGKGMYDRFLPNLKHKVHIIFVAKSPNIAQDVITQPYDTLGDCFFTASAICRRKKNGSVVCDRKYNLRIIGRN